MNYYMVGGYVRDELLGVKSKDIDFAVEADSYEAMKQDILDKGYIIFQERPEYFAIRGRHPIYGGVDFTLCRKDGFYSDFRRPDSVQIGTIYDDLARRDFTVNAIARTEYGEYIDPHGGIKDIGNKFLRCVGNSWDRFSEDPLRLLRAIRFHIVRDFRLGVEIDSILYDNEMLDKLETIPLERIYEELRRCFEHDSWRTLFFFRAHPYLERLIFKDMGLSLSPVIR